MVSNLVSNAIDAYEDFPGVDRRVVVNLEVEGKDAVLTVQDFGKGIAPEHLEKIFEPFFTTKDLEKGTGIGLSTTKHLIEQELRGSITVASGLGQGTVFTIHFPV
jgi:two-component system NtrC family sensor kinase